MADPNRVDDADRFAAGSGRTDNAAEQRDDFLPGVTGGTTYVPGSPPAGANPANQGEGTIGAVGEMDFTGAPAGPGGGSGAAESRGGGPGGGALSSGGTGPSVKGTGPQTVESTLERLGDKNLADANDVSGTGGKGGAAGSGGAGGSDLAGDDAVTKKGSGAGGAAAGQK